MARRRRRLRARLRDLARRLVAFLFSNLGVIVLVVLYTIAGAFMFQAIEGATETERASQMVAERNSTAHCLWENTMQFNTFNETGLKQRITLELTEYQHKVVWAIRRGWDGRRFNKQWSFSSSFLYSLTVITTIGYGHISPRTSLGKVITIFYTLLGMPIFLLYLANIGSLLARWFKCIYALVCLCRGCPGFSRRRALRLRNQLEISDVESIERPHQWRSDSENDWIPLDRYPDRRYQRCSTLPLPRRRRSPNFDRCPRIPEDEVYYPYEMERRPYQKDFRRRLDEKDLRMSYPSYMESRRYQNYMESRRYADYMESRRGYPDKMDARRYPDQMELKYRDLKRYPDWRIVQDRFQRPYPEFRRGWSAPALHSDHSDFSVVSFDAQAINVPISVCVAILVGYIMFGSMIFGLWEKWDQVDGAYFCFISLSSIGFGDFVPGERVFSARIETSFIVCSMYLMLGMALVAMCFNLMQEQVIHYVTGFKRAVKRICRCKR